MEHIYLYILILNTI